MTPDSSKLPADFAVIGAGLSEALAGLGASAG